MVLNASGNAVRSVQAEHSTPAYRQISHHFERLVRDGELRPGDRLPTVREVARRTGFNKGTVCQGFADLQRHGLVVSRPGRGTVVADQPGATAPFPVAERIQGLYRSLKPESARRAAPSLYDFASLWPEPGLFPSRALGRILERLLRGTPELLQYGPAQGYAPLRKYLEERAGRLGVGDGEVLIVQGSQQGLDLVFRTFLNPGEAVAVESPTYANIFPQMALHQARVVPIRMETDGLALEELHAATRRDGVKALYFMPNFQNPTGVTMSERKRDQLARFAASAGLLVVEDDFEHDLHFTGRAKRPVAGRVPLANVIYLSSFSKSLLPGLRLGWMVVPRSLAQPLILAKKYTDIYTSVLIQAALLEFCRSGQYDRHVRRLRRVYRDKTKAAQAAVQRQMPRGTTCAEPEGGFSLWVTLPAGYDADALAAEAVHHGVHITPGSMFHANGRDGERSFRLSLSLMNGSQIEAGIRILGKLLRRPQGRLRRSAEEVQDTPYL